MGNNADLNSEINFIVKNATTGIFNSKKPNERELLCF